MGCGLKESRIGWGSRSSLGMGTFEGETHAQTCPTTLCQTVQKWLNRSRFCFGYGLGWPKEACVRWSRETPSEGGILQERTCWACMMILAVSCAKNGCTNGDAAWVVGLDVLKEASIRWRSRSRRAKEQFVGERTCQSMPNDTAVSCAKMAEPIKIPFGLWTWVGRRMHVLHGEHSGATWRIRLNRP